MSDEIQKKAPPSGAGAYQRNQVLTASREGVLLLLYEGAIRFMKSAIESAEQSKHSEKLKSLDRVRAIVKEFRKTLNFETGGELAHNLDRLYAFVLDRVAQGALDKEPRGLREALGVLEQLHRGWQQAIESLKTSGKGAEK